MTDGTKHCAELGRRSFLCAAGGALAGLGCGSSGGASHTQESQFLNGHETADSQDAKPATLRWFRECGFGLALEYGAFSQLGRHADVQFDQTIPVDQYQKLRDTFQAGGFHAGQIASLAAAAGMKYINLNIKHHDGFCLFRTNHSEFTTLDSPLRRDLALEMTEACDNLGLGLFVSYSYALDWTHPYFFSNEAAGPDWDRARPHYTEDPPYLYRREEDFTNYLNFAHAQLEEILYRYRPLAGVCLNPLIGYFSRPDLFPIGYTYQILRDANPAALICFEEGASGKEDFVSTARTLPGPPPEYGPAAQQAWVENRGKPLEIRRRLLQDDLAGDSRRTQGKRRTPGEVMELLDEASKSEANLLLGTALLPDGSVHPEDIETLLEVGKKR